MYTLPTPMADFSVYFQIIGGNTGGVNRSLFVTDSDTTIYFSSAVATGRFIAGADSGTNPLGILSHTYGSPKEWRHVWIDGTSTTRKIFVSTSTSATKPASPVESFTGSYSDINRLVFGHAQTLAYWIDKVRLSTTEIGSNPD